MRDIAKWIAHEEQWCANNYAPLPIVAKRGKGVYLWDVDDTRYLDMMSAYSAVSHGHGHPKMLKAFTEQAEQLCVTSRAVYHHLLGDCCQKLCEFANMDMALMMNTGVEAVETGIKAARRWGYQVKGIPNNKAEIIVARDNFHGRTTTVTSFSTDPAYQEGFGPFTPGFVVVPFNDAAAIERAITPNTCAVLLEPMQGEAGIKIPSTGWLTKVAKLCENTQTLLIVDEVQTGMGRTGKPFAHQHENVKVDGMIVGKALGGGMMPVSAFLASRELMSVFNPGSHGSTFGGNPLACAVAMKAIDIIQEEQLTERSAKLGKSFLTALSALKHPAIVDVRGAGLWIGIEFDPKRLQPQQVSKALLKEGVLAKDVHDTVVRFAPPLVIEDEQLTFTVEALRRVLDTLTS